MINRLEYFFFLFLRSCTNYINSFYQFLAQFLNYPENPGMPIIKPDNVVSYFERSIYPKFPLRYDTAPTTWVSSIIGENPSLNSIKKFFYYSNTDGYYSFYINPYSNTTFLPDEVSKWLQLNLNFYLDTTLLETIQESVFIILILYMKFISFRLNLFWFITINPFVRPWVYLTSLVDWTYDVTSALLPGVFGVDLGIIIYLALVGKLIDMVNCLVFTMPFLPSEAEVGLLEKDPNIRYLRNPDLRFLLNKVENKTVIFFRYLPHLWYEYPIPNELREYWFYQRPDILKYMIENYEQLGINFYPDDIWSNLEKYQISDPYPANINKLESLINLTFVHYDDSYIYKFDYLITIKNELITSLLQNN